MEPVLLQPAGLPLTQVPILKGVYSDRYGRLKAALPVNLEPNIVDTGLSEGQMTSPPGVTLIGTGPGEDRGAIVWKGVCYRVMGTKLVSVVGSLITILGDVGSGGPVAMDYSFDRLGIGSGGKLFYWTPTEGVTQVTDPDLGLVIDVIWIDSYWMTTDGISLVVTDLNDPYSVDPLKYGSSEVDPDSIVALRKIRGQVYAINRNTVENFQNTGGTGFPFSRNPGGMIPKGGVSSRSRCDFLESFAFAGSGRGEALSVYLAGPGQAAPLSTPEIDGCLAELTDAEQAAIEMETRVEEGEQRLYIHLPTKTLVYYQQASKKNQAAVWAILAGGTLADQAYPAKHMALVGGRWLVGSPTGQVGYLDKSVDTLFGVIVGWLLHTVFVFNETNGFILKSVELTGMPGLTPFGQDATVFMSTTEDGRTWGQERAISMGRAGDRAKRMQWRPCRKFGQYAGKRFRGANASIASFARLDVDAEGLA